MADRSRKRAVPLTRATQTSASPQLAEPPCVTAAAARATSAAAAPGPHVWRPIGPFSIPHGQTYGKGPASRPSVSGRVSSVAIDPGDPKHILIGSGGGGVWESHDEGLTWAPRTDGAPSLSVGVVAFDPQNPRIVYAGTGEGDDTSVDPDDRGRHLLGAGLLRSEDGGGNWELHAAGPLRRLGFFDIAVEPSHGDHLLVGTSRGLYLSTNGGKAWRRRRSTFTWKIAFGTLRTTAGSERSEGFAACADGLFRSTNGGATWSAVPLPGASQAFERLTVCHAPSDPNVVYAFGARAVPVPDDVKEDERTRRVARLWRRSVFGGAFELVPLPADLEVNQAWYDWCAAVAPHNADILYIGGIDLHKGVRSATDVWSWENISAKKPRGDCVHPDQHAIAFSPADPNVVYAGNDGGIYRSPDAGVSWKSLNKGLNITQIEFLAQHPHFDAWLLAGTQDNGTLRYQGDTVWFHVADGDGGDCGVNIGSPYVCYHTFYEMGVSRSRRGGDWSSFTPGPQWIVGPFAKDEDDFPDGALFYPPVEVHGRVVVQAGRRVFLSGDEGKRWTSRLLPDDEITSALTMPSERRVYCGTTEGRIFRIDAGPRSWRQPVELRQPSQGWVSDLLVDPTDGEVLYATYMSGAGRVFRSDDGGASWTRADAGLRPDLPVNAVEIDPDDPGTLWCAADVGVYITRNSGGVWAPFHEGLPNALVKDLAFHPIARVLRAGTQSRGVWEVDVDVAEMRRVEVYVRDSSVDTGRFSPSPYGVNDPFAYGARAYWWQCKDIKVDGPAFRHAAVGDVDFEAFSDDQSLKDAGIEFAAGLTNENPQRDRTVRVFVQVHNRGVRSAKNVLVKVFYAAAGTTFPRLPRGFWKDFPRNVVSPRSPWQPIGPHQTIQTIGARRAEITGFEWKVPAGAPEHIALLAIVSAANDRIKTKELDTATLVRTQKQCGLRNVTIVNPPADVGPRRLSMPLAVPAGTDLEIDPGACKLLRGVVLAKSLVPAAGDARWTKVRLRTAERLELERVVTQNPRLKKELALETAFMPARPLRAPGRGEHAFVLLLQVDPQRGSGSVVVRSPQGHTVSGITLQAQ